MEKVTKAERQRLRRIWGNLLKNNPSNAYIFKKAKEHGVKPKKENAEISK